MASTVLGMRAVHARSNANARTSVPSISCREQVKMNRGAQTFIENGGFKSGASPASSERTVVVFDWDDTLCPSTWLHASGLLPKFRGQSITFTAEQRLIMDLISMNVVRLLKKAATYGPVFIVTAAEYGWVELSCELFMPSVQHMLDLPDIHIVSARTWYEQSFGFSGNPSSWKFEVLQLIAQKCFGEDSSSEGYYSFISIGDSMAERDACHLAIENVSCTYAKTLKYVEHPSWEDLVQQMELTHESFDQMCLSESSLDLQLTQSQLKKLKRVHRA